MSSGQIKVADHKGVFVIKMEGDVRLTLCLSFDEFIEHMFAAPDFCAVIFDLCDAVAIDSTTLGLMAKISIRGRAMEFDAPYVVSSNPNITRLLASMGFEDIFYIVESADALEMPIVDTDSATALDENIVDESQVHNSVLDAHRTLMELNSTNHNTFKELVAALEGEQKPCR